MKRLAYRFGVTHTAWMADMDVGCPPPGFGEAVAQRDGRVCQMCGDEAPIGPTFHHIDGDHERWDARNVALVCHLCHATQHWNRPSIDEELVLIWAPWISQPDLNALVGGIHRVFHRHGEHPRIDVTPKGDGPTLCAAYRTYLALAAQAAEAKRAVETSSPLKLGAALLELGERPLRADGLRLLHKGRYFHKGRDIYPDLLDEASLYPGAEP